MIAGGWQIPSDASHCTHPRPVDSLTFMFRCIGSSFFVASEAKGLKPLGVVLDGVSGLLKDTSLSCIPAVIPWNPVCFVDPGVGVGSPGVLGEVTTEPLWLLPIGPHSNPEIFLQRQWQDRTHHYSFNPGIITSCCFCKVYRSHSSRATNVLCSTPEVEQQVTSQQPTNLNIPIKKQYTYLKAARFRWWFGLSCPLFLCSNGYLQRLHAQFSTSVDCTEQGMLIDEAYPNQNISKYSRWNILTWMVTVNEQSVRTFTVFL